MRAKFIVTVWLLFGAASVYGFLERTPDSYLLISKDQTRCCFVETILRGAGQ